LAASFISGLGIVTGLPTVRSNLAGAGFPLTAAPPHGRPAAAPAIGYQNNIVRSTGSSPNVLTG